MSWRLGWVCEGCTFDNAHPEDPVCEICQQPAPGTIPPDQPRQHAPLFKSACHSQIELSRARDELANIDVISLGSGDSTTELFNFAPASPQKSDPKCQHYAKTKAADLFDCKLCRGTLSEFEIGVESQDRRVAVQSSFRNKECDDFEVITLSDGDAEPQIRPSQGLDIFENCGDNSMSGPLPKEKHPSRSSNVLTNVSRKKLALNNARMLGQYFWSEIVVHIPEVVWSKYSPFIRESMESLRGDIGVFSVSDRKNWITWERKRIEGLLEPECFDKANNRLILDQIDSVSTVPVPFCALFYEAADFIEEYKSGEIVAQIRVALQSPETHVALIVFDLRRVVRLRANKSMRRRLAQHSPSENNDADVLSNVGMIDEFAASLIDQFSCRCSFLIFSNLNEIGMFLCQTTRHIAQQPYKPDATSSLGFRHQNVVKSAVVGGIYTPSMKEWFNVLIRIPGISPKRAEGIIRRFPSCASLLLAYGNCQSVEERKLMLKDIEVDERSFGSSLSSTVFDYLYSD